MATVLARSSIQETRDPSGRPWYCTTPFVLDGLKVIKVVMVHSSLFHVNSSEIITEMVRCAVSHTLKHKKLTFYAFNAFWTNRKYSCGEKTTEADITAQCWLTTNKLWGFSDF